MAPRKRAPQTQKTYYIIQLGRECKNPKINKRRINANEPLNNIMHSPFIGADDVTSEPIDYFWMAKMARKCLRQWSIDYVHNVDIFGWFFFYDDDTYVCILMIVEIAFWSSFRVQNLNKNTNFFNVFYINFNFVIRKMFSYKMLVQFKCSFIEINWNSIYFVQ